MINAITEAGSLEQVVEIINKSKLGHSTEYYGGSDSRDAEEMAGQYAWEAAKECDCTSDDNIEAQLDYLREAGANFDFNGALKNAINRKKLLS